MNTANLKQAAEFLSNLEKAGVLFPDPPTTSNNSWELTSRNLLRNGAPVADLTWTGNPATMGHSFEVPRTVLGELLHELTNAQVECNRWRYTGGHQQHLVACNANRNSPIGGPGCICAVVHKDEADKLRAQEVIAAQTKVEAPVAIQWNRTETETINGGFRCFIRRDYLPIGSVHVVSKEETIAIADKIVASLNFCEGIPLEDLMGSAEGCVQRIKVLTSAMKDFARQNRELYTKQMEFENLAQRFAVLNEELLCQLGEAILKSNAA